MAALENDNRHGLHKNCLRRALVQRVAENGVHALIQSLNLKRCLMLRGMLDLHTHSYYSDGSVSPRELVDRALQKEISVIALTDHDSVAGCAEFMEAAAGNPIVAVPGVELSTRFQGISLHIVGLALDMAKIPDAKEFLQTLARMHHYRISRMQQMLAVLQRRDEREGVPETEWLSFQEVRAFAPDAILTRSFVRLALQHKLKKLGHGDPDGEAERRTSCLGRGQPDYLEYDDAEAPSALRAIEMITALGGIPILAHPTEYGGKLSERHVELMKDAGLAGIELLYNHPLEPQVLSELNEWRLLCERLGLSASMGSDYHGAFKTISLGQVGD